MAGAETAMDAKPKSDLPVRTVSAVAMLAIAALAFWLGGLTFDFFVAMVATTAFAEMVGLVLKCSWSSVRKAIWIALGAVYIGLGAATLIVMEGALVLGAVLVVIFTDTGAYFAGRRFGRHKIAPSISPSKSWEGLVGGMIAAGIVGGLMLGTIVAAVSHLSADPVNFHWGAFLVGFGSGAALAVAAQAGDFLESWLKRQAGVKDSSRLIPGHGGVLDRVDGLLAVAFILSLVMLYSMLDGW